LGILLERASKSISGAARTSADSGVDDEVGSVDRHLLLLTVVIDPLTRNDWSRCSRDRRADERPCRDDACNVIIIVCCRPSSSRRATGRVRFRPAGSWVVEPGTSRRNFSTDRPPAWFLASWPCPRGLGRKLEPHSGLSLFSNKRPAFLLVPTRACHNELSKSRHPHHKQITPPDKFYHLFAHYRRLSSVTPPPNFSPPSPNNPSHQARCHSENSTPTL